jgi:hypothetical protein
MNSLCIDNMLVTRRWHDFASSSDTLEILLGVAVGRSRCEFGRARVRIKLTLVKHGEEVVNVK